MSCVIDLCQKKKQNMIKVLFQYENKYDTGSKYHLERYDRFTWSPLLTVSQCLLIVVGEEFPWFQKRRLNILIGIICGQSVALMLFHVLAQISTLRHNFRTNRTLGTAAAFLHVTPQTTYFFIFDATLRAHKSRLPVIHENHLRLQQCQPWIWIEHADDDDDDDVGANNQTHTKKKRKKNIKLMWSTQLCILWTIYNIRKRRKVIIKEKRR